MRYLHISKEIVRHPTTQMLVVSPARGHTYTSDGLKQEARRLRRKFKLSARQMRKKAKASRRAEKELTG